MYSHNHFLTAFNLLLILYHEQTTVWRIALFAFLFGTLVDIDMLVKRKLKIEDLYVRSWVQEPAGLFLVGLPIAFLMAEINPLYFQMVLIPYALHMFLDYITVHEVYPRAPFSHKPMKVGFIKPLAKDPRIHDQKGISEQYIFYANVIVTLYLVVFII